MPQFERPGASIHYEVTGNGPPLLLIAGTASDNASWGPLIPPLREQFRLIMIDNRGSGRTLVSGPLSIDTMVEDCATLLNHLGIETAAVVGHSLGGMIGLRLAAQYPALVSRLVTMTSGNGVGAKERALFKDMAALYPAIRPQAWFRLLFQWLFSPPFFESEATVAAAADASSNYLDRQTPVDFARQVAMFDHIVPFNVAQVPCPTLAIAAANDLLVPPAAMFASLEGMPSLQTRTISGAAHSVHWEAPEAVAEAIVGFLRGQS